MKEKDIKLLWGRAANRCSICRIELSQDANSASFVVGEQAHIIGAQDGAPRGISPLTLEQRNSYHNIVLLCPNDHTTIDKNENDWPVERLHLIKSEHELWVKENLSQSTDVQLLADQLAITSLIDSVVESCSLYTWNDWVAGAYGYDGRVNPGIIAAYKFRVKVAAAIIPETFSEIGRAAFTLSILFHQFHDTFMQHVELVGNAYRVDKFYKKDGFNKNYDADLVEYNEWIDKFCNLLLEATKAANWFAEVVRRDVNPLFFVDYGRFVLHTGLRVDLNYHSVIPQFSQKEKDNLPSTLN